MNFQWIMYGFNIIMLIVVRIAGDSANGAARWIGIGSFRFQPTELSEFVARFFLKALNFDSHTDAKFCIKITQGLI